MKPAPRGLFVIFFLVDIAFLLYWAITWIQLLPPEMLYKDYADPILVDWNWSFFPIDILISASGLYSIRLYSTKSSQWMMFAQGSLYLTMCSGLMAVSFWSFHHDYDLTWWMPNLFLLLYPLFYIRKVQHK